MAELEPDWLCLEKRSDCSFFLSWLWIKTWLTTFKEPFQVLRVHCRGQLVGLALVRTLGFRRWGWAPSDRMYLHQTGCRNRDQIWIEYNGFLCAEGYEKSVVSQVFSYLASDNSWDEFVVGGVTSQKAKLMEEESHLNRLDLWQAPTYGVELNDSVRSGNYLASLSKNTRYQINRSGKIYSELYGEVLLDVASNIEDALSFFRMAGPLHQARWGDKLGQSGYSNKYFVEFHCNLIEAAWPSRNLDLIRIQAGTHTLGYFYNFLYRGKVYFYLSGLTPEENPKLKPGLSAHALAIQYYADRGYDYYDFMGGDARYKASLGKKSLELCQVCFRRDRFKFKLEDGLRSMKRVLGAVF